MSQHANDALPITRQPGHPGGVTANAFAPMQHNPALYLSCAQGDGPGAHRRRVAAAAARRAAAEEAGELLQTSDCDVLTQSRRGPCGACKECSGFCLLFRWALEGGCGGSWGFLWQCSNSACHAAAGCVRS